MDNKENQDNKVNQGEKQVQKRSPNTQTEQVDNNYAFAVVLEQQENPYTMLEMIESDESDDEETEDDYSYNEGNFITGEQFVDLMFYEEGENSNMDDEMEEDEDEDEDEEDDIDPDELTYEELLELGEIIGEESRGLSPEEIFPTLSPYTCKSMQSKTSIDRCVICQMEYDEGEDLVALRCEHPFHAGCIIPWLQIKKTCPICSKEVIKQKTV